MGRRKHVILKFSRSISDIKVAAVLEPHNSYTDMIKWYENGLSSVEDDHTGLILLLVGSQFDAFIGEEEACEILKN